MKFTLTFKTPDLIDQVQSEDGENYTWLAEEEQKPIEAIFKKFIKYGEYCSIKFDTDTMTATVLEQ